jgi:hypothetical protein
MKATKNERSPAPSLRERIERCSNRGTATDFLPTGPCPTWEITVVSFETWKMVGTPAAPDDYEATSRER